jgi:20S proteasome alpha/beta subunit
MKEASMTICIAALYGGGEGCILASDQMTTAQIPMGYEFENDEVEKIVKIKDSAEVYALIAGDVLFANEVIAAARGEANSQGTTATPLFAELFRKSYQQIRRLHIVRNELEPRALTIDSYYQLQQRISPQVVQIIDNALTRWNPRVELIIAGVGEVSCSIFTVMNPGDCICHDPIGFAAVGSGSPHAMYSLIESGYKKSMDKSMVEDLVRQAKKRSEVAPGVGSGTKVVVIPG